MQVLLEAGMQGSWFANIMPFIYTLGYYRIAGYTGSLVSVCKPSEILFIVSLFIALIIIIISDWNVPRKGADIIYHFSAQKVITLCLCCILHISVPHL